MGKIDHSTIRATMDEMQAGIALRIKVVPGASRSKIVGVLGDRLKIAVAAPAEAGKANKAVCLLVAKVFGVAPRDVEITSGHTLPRKTVDVAGVSLAAATASLLEAVQ